ncbi:hypothetical protein AQUCO_01300179v1 [Aquilegia coerulea]|uniref:Protein kinase domain-containing protein n=1 Tax=Aquilegia coerulea TaxID=218851 RepID=A0A2G5E029_AQUCA|nr:hypothetical protein AQUCO_01300179v1 [Aquilegia coerulea]
MSTLSIYLLAVLLSRNIDEARTISCHQTHCGNIWVPNPFAIGKGCGISPDFDLVYSQRPETEVIEISVSQRTLKVKLGESTNCQGDGIQEIRSFESSIFKFSPTANKFIAIGCDMSASILEPDNYGLLHGCTSYCSNESSTSHSVCNGLGCCQTSLPATETKSYSWRIDTVKTEKGASMMSLCNYGVIVSDDFTQFERLKKLDSKYMYQTLPAVLDWVVSNTTCQEAEKNQATYGCKPKNNKCVDGPNGYDCLCNKGYQGTAFELGGCERIDLCNTKDTPCVDSARCTYINGRKNPCKCPFFYFGDGTKLGSGCYFGYHFLLIVLGSITISTVLYFGISYVIMANKKKEVIRIKECNYKKNGGQLLEERLSQSGARCTKFSIEEIRKITDDFSDKRVIGNGGSGTVFKGLLADGEDVAVKKSQEVDERHINDFINEIVILSQLREKNIVRLIGYCFEDQCPILVYEYVSNGPLSKHIHNPNLSPLSWIERISIAAEIASALSYLHYGVPTTVIHRDVKPENILLTERSNAKLGDFGVSRTIPSGKTHGITAQQCGTTGYVDPNMIDDFREEHDVYGFGMVLVELLTKRLAYTLALEYRATLAKKPLEDILDTRVPHTRLEDPLQRMVNLAASCIELLGERPNMKEVAAEMSKI